MEQRLVLIGGLPGAGKSTRAVDALRAFRVTHGWDDPLVHVEADGYFMQGGVYRFEAAKLGEAHAWCRGLAEGALWGGAPLVGVANTGSRRWEREPYRKLAERYGAAFEWVDLFDGGKDDAELARRNLHGVPAEAIGRMCERWER